VGYTLLLGTSGAVISSQWDILAPIPLPLLPRVTNHRYERTPCQPDGIFTFAAFISEL
jgi:hypothetical protein